jgi:hypothetical protein
MAVFGYSYDFREVLKLLLEDKMSEFSNEPIVPGSSPEMSLIDTWIAAFTKPKEETYARIAAPTQRFCHKGLFVGIPCFVAYLSRQPGCESGRANG